jgi:hypothetical protein
MKYAITWKRKRHGSTAEFERAERRVLALMRRWRRPDGVTIREFVVRQGESGGYAIFETDDLGKVEQAARVFAGFNFHIDPVQDGDPALTARRVATEWRDAAV